MLLCQCLAPWDFLDWVIVPGKSGKSACEASSFFQLQMYKGTAGKTALANQSSPVGGARSCRLPFVENLLPSAGIEILEICPQID
jgi:hypothetical protein